MMPRGVFVTGTDTDAGKTWTAAGLLLALRDRGLRVAGMKPVACGCEATAAGMRNDDALLLRRCSSDASLPYEAVNPYAFQAAVSPHLAAAQAGVPIDLPHARACLERLAREAEFIVVEGAGGWEVPIDGCATMADLAREFGLPVILTVGMRLGCLNHALLTSAAIRARGLPLAGWIANVVDGRMRMVDENIATLAERIPAPLLGIVPHLAAFDGPRIAACLDAGALLRAG